MSLNSEPGGCSPGPVGRARAASSSAPGWERPPSGVGPCARGRPLGLLWAVAAGLAPPPPSHPAPRTPGAVSGGFSPLWAEPGAQALPPLSGPGAPHARGPGASGRGSGLALWPREREGSGFISVRLLRRPRRTAKPYFYPDALEAQQEVFRKLVLNPHFVAIKEIRECSLNGLLGSYFSTFGAARCSFAFLKTRKEKKSIK